MEHEGRLVQWRVCDCGTEGLCLDGPESVFPANTYDERGRATGWRTLCRSCWNAYQREHRQGDVRGQANARRRKRHAERMLSDPEYVEQRRREANARYARDPQRRQRVAAANRRWVRTYPKRVRDRDAAYRAARAEREGREYHPRSYVTDGTAPREPVAAFLAWLVAYRRERCLPDVTAVAKELGLEERGLRRVLSGEYRKVGLDVIDRALLHARIAVRVNGRAIYVLSDLYPSPLAD